MYIVKWCFPGGSVVKNPPASAKDLGLVPGSGRSPGERNGNPLQYEFQGQRILGDYSPWDSKQLETTEWLRAHTHTHTHSEMITMIRLVNTPITHGLPFFCVVRIFKIYSLDFPGDPVVKTPGSQCREPQVQFLFKELRSCMLLGSAKKEINTRSYKIFSLGNLQVEDSVLLILVIKLRIRFPRIYPSYNWKFVSFDHHHPFPMLWWPPIYFLIL